MPIENEVLRQKRERQFQARVLAAVEKPKRNRFLAIINAPIVLWLLSAAALSFVPLLYQTRQQCMQQSGTLIMDRILTQSEIDQRVEYFKQAVLSAKTAKQLQDTLRKRKVSYSDFRTKTLFDLLQDQSKIVSYLPIDDRITLAEQSIKWPRIIVWAASAENNDIDDDTFNDLKKEVTQQTPTLPNATEFFPQCSITSIIGLAISGSREYLRAIPFDRP